MTTLNSLSEELLRVILGLLEEADLKSLRLTYNSTLCRVALPMLLNRLHIKIPPRTKFSDKVSPQDAAQILTGVTKHLHLRIAEEPRKGRPKRQNPHPLNPMAFSTIFKFKHPPSGFSITQAMDIYANFFASLTSLDAAFQYPKHFQIQQNGERANVSILKLATNLTVLKLRFVPPGPRYGCGHGLFGMFAPHYPRLEEFSLDDLKAPVRADNLAGFLMQHKATLKWLALWRCFLVAEDVRYRSVREFVGQLAMDCQLAYGGGVDFRRIK